MSGQIEIYQSPEGAQIEVQFEQGTVWLNRQQLADLFGRDIKTIWKHLNNAFKEGELDKGSTVAKFATVQNEGGREVKSAINQIAQAFGDEDIYPILEEKAAMLLYLVEKTMLLPMATSE